MKRSSPGSVSVEREVEIEQNEINERKRARMSDHSNGESESPPNNENSEIPSEELGEASGDRAEYSEMQTNHVNLKANLSIVTPEEQNGVEFAHMKTSTPINQNGIVNNTLNTHLQNNNWNDQSPLPRMSISANTENEQVREPDSVPNEEPPVLTAENLINNNVSGEELTDVEDQQSKDGSEDIDENSSHSSKKSSETSKASTSPPAEERSVPQTNNVYADSKCDVDYFLNSLLQVSALQGHADNILSVAADGDIILSSSRDTTIKRWDPVTKKETHNFQGHSDAVNTILLLPCDQASKLSAKLGLAEGTRIVISGSSDCSVRIWSLDSGTEILSLYTYNCVTCLGYFPEEDYIVLATDGGKLEIWDPCNSKVVHSVLAHDDKITSLEVDDCYVYTASLDGKVKVWLLDDDELQVIYTRTRKEPEQAGSLLKPCQWKCVTSFDNKMYLGDNTTNLKILDWKAGRLRMLKNQVQRISTTNALCTKENVLLSSSYNPEAKVGAINVWQLPSVTYICTMSGDVGQILSLSMTETKDGVLRVVSGGSKLLSWDFICSKPPSEMKDNSYFCQEIDHLGEEIEEKPVTIARKNDPGSTPLPRSESWNCNIL